MMNNISGFQQEGQQMVYARIHLNGSDMYAALVALKLSRHSYNYKQDNLLDAVAYLGALDNYVELHGYKDSEDPLS